MIGSGDQSNGVRNDQANETDWALSGVKGAALTYNPTTTLNKKRLLFTIQITTTGFDQPHTPHLLILLRQE